MSCFATMAAVTTFPRRYALPQDVRLLTLSTGARTVYIHAYSARSASRPSMGEPHFIISRYVHIARVSWLDSADAWL